MNGIFTRKFFIRLSSLISVAVFGLLTLFFAPGIFPAESVYLGFFCGLCTLSLYPVTYEASKNALVQALAVESADLFIVFVLLNSSLLLPILLSFNVIYVNVLSIWSAILKFGRIKSLFRYKAVLVSAQDHYRQVIRLGVVSLSMVLLESRNVPALQWICVSLAIPFYAAVHYSCWSDRILLFSKGKEKTMRELILGNLRSIPYVSDDEDARMSLLFTRVTKYMEQEKPFLHNNYTVKELAAAVFSNRSYLSKTINYFSGKNFNQFLNYYRVMYAIDLMKRDLNMKMLEIANLSGFHSMVTFNMSFRIYVEDTPAAYREKLWLESKRDKENN